ncbi:MAG: DUF935 family protein [Porphyromonas sp.]|nr:DUF935 family protein [Porphyromonas sp.]
MAKKNKANKRIIQGGTKPVRLHDGSMQAPSVILKMPEIFMLDLEKFMRAVKAAQKIDDGRRSALYDLYESAKLDLHYMGVLDKRLRGITRIPIEFHRNGKPDDQITPQIKSPWFKEVRKEIVMSELWGFSLMQFYLDDEGNIRADQINRKHYNPITRELLREQNDEKGIPLEDFDNMLLVGKERELGMLLDVMIAILYKRGNISDWAKFCNIFGVPIRKYTYDAGDEEARQRVLRDARTQGSTAVYIQPSGSNMELLESRNTWGTGELFKSFTDYWDSKISIRILGNTLTTDAKSTGSQALGEVHKEVEDEMNANDRDNILDVLNYYMRPIFANLGFNVEGGEFVYAKHEKTNATQQVDIVLKLHSIGLPIDDNYLYEFSGIPKPDNYDQMIAEREAERETLKAHLEGPSKTEEQEEQEDEEEDLKEEDKVRGNNPPKPKNSVAERLRAFFGLAPTGMGADSDF